MKRLILTACLAASCLGFSTGCNTTSFETTGPDGRVTKVSNNRLAWASQKYLWQYNPSNGLFSASSDASSPDAATIQAVLDFAKTLIAAHP